MKINFEKVLIVLTILGLIVFVAYEFGMFKWDNIKEQTETKETPIVEFTNDELKDIATQKAIRDWVDINGYRDEYDFEWLNIANPIFENNEEVFFKMLPVYDISESCDMADNLFKNNKIMLDELKKIENSIFYDKYGFDDEDDDNMFRILNKICDSIKSGKQLIREDIEYLKWWVNLGDTFRKSVEKDKALKEFKGVWIFKNEGRYLFYNITIPKKEDFNADDVKIYYNEHRYNEDFDYVVKKWKTDTELYKDYSIISNQFSESYLDEIDKMEKYLIKNVK